MKTNIFSIFTRYLKTSRTEDSQSEIYSAQNAINHLMENPEKFMTENRIIPLYDEKNKKDTSIINTVLFFDDENKIFRFNHSDEQNKTMDVLYTKMRETECEDRFMAPSVIQIKENYLTINKNEHHFISDSMLWLTTRQTGCSVLIVDYGRKDNGSEQYAMIHMQPRNSDTLEDDLPIYFKCNTQEMFLEEDLSKFLINGKLPVKYILVHSEETNFIDDKCTQLVGISDCDGKFTFYKQLYEPCGLGEENTVEKIEWTILHNEQDVLLKGHSQLVSGVRCL